MKWHRHTYLAGLLITISNIFIAEATVPNDTTYVVGVSAGYGYNETYAHYGLFTLDTRLPISSHFAGEVNTRAQTVNSYDFSFHLYPIFPLKSGKLFFDMHILYNLNARNRIHGLCGGLSFGYTMDYVELSVGYGIRLSAIFGMSKRTAENGLFEPHNLLYHVELYARPRSSIWNISACISNVTDYQQERMFTPVFFIKNYVMLRAHWKLKTEIACKPVGLSNLSPSFYGATGRIGIEYHF